MCRDRENAKDVSSPRTPADVFRGVKGVLMAKTIIDPETFILPQL
jgi:hypothetical protein